MERLTRSETDSHVKYTIGHTRWSFDKRDHSRLQEAFDELYDYQSIGTVEEFRALKEAEQKRREGCIRCERKTCDTCYRFGWHPDICRKCENQSHYSAKPFCSHCGRDLKGESHEQM